MPRMPGYGHKLNMGWPRAYSKTLFSTVLFAQGDEAVVLEGGNEMAAPCSDEVEVLL